MPPLSFRHEDSFRGVINFNRIVLSPENFDTAHQAFERFTKLYEDGELELQPHRGYKKITLIRETFHHCKDRDAFLQHFFTAIGVMHYRDTAMGFAQGLSAIEDFISQPPAEHQARLLSDYADDLLIFYAKMKARHTEDVIKSPSHLSKSATPNGQRRETLRTDCLRRDRHRCVVTRFFHRPEAYRRRRESGPLKTARDDDGKVIDLRQPGGECYDLEVAHIIPFSILHSREGKELDHSQKFAITVLDMFDSDISALIDGVEIDTPKNALSLERSIHKAFGAFEIYFDEVESNRHAYRVFSHDEVISDVNGFPRDVDFTNPMCQDIDPPSRRLLAIHRAISEILHLSAAGQYIDEIFREMEEPGVRSNGSTKLGDILSLKLNDVASGDGDLVGCAG